MPTLCLVALNCAWYQSNPALYGLREALRGLPWRIRLREFALSEQPCDVLAALVRLRPDVICFSAYIWNRPYLEGLVFDVKKLLPEARIVLGGPEAAQGDFGLDGRDFTVLGPGEGTIRYLAESGFSLPGGTYERPAPPLALLPFPYRASDRASLRSKLLYYESSRGCPFRCVYCLSANDDRREFRFDPSNARDRRRLRSELDRCIALSPRTIKFLDRSFNVQIDLARLVWRYAIGLREACEFHFEIYPDLLEPEDLALLSQAHPGRLRFEIGIQSTDPAILRACGRSTNWQRVKPLLQALREQTPVTLHLDLLAGLPGQNLASVLSSLDEVASVFPQEIQLGLLKILPGTPMQEIARERGYLWQDRPPYQVLRSDTLSFAQIISLQELARVINLYWNKGEFTAQWRSWLDAGYPASTLFLRIWKAHRKDKIPFFGISRQTRAEIFPPSCHTSASTSFSC